MIIAILWFVAAAQGTQLAAAGSDTSSKEMLFTKHFNDSLFTMTENGEFSVEILPDEREYRIGKDVIGIVIHNRHDEDVEGAKISISLEPAGDNTQEPVIRDKGDGLYTVKNLPLQREGEWKLIIRINRKKIEDSAVFSFPAALSRPLPAGTYKAGARPFEDQNRSVSEKENSR